MNKKEIVIEKARELFSEYGYKKVSMDEIAKEANVTKKTIYTYFKDKDSMFQYFILEELEKMKAPLEEKKKKSSSFTSFVSESLYYVLTYRKNSKLISTIIKEVGQEKEAKASTFLKFYDTEIINYIESNIKEEIESGNIKECDSRLTAFIIYKVYIAVMFEYERELDEEKVTKEITSILKDGLLN